VEDRRRGAQGPRCLVGGDHAGHADDDGGACGPGEDVAGTGAKQALEFSTLCPRCKREQPSARHSWMHCRLNAVVSSRVRELQEALSPGTVELEISSRNSRVAALQTLGQCGCRNAIIQTIANSRARSGSQRQGCRNGSCKCVVRKLGRPGILSNVRATRPCTSASETQPRSHSGKKNHRRNLPRSQSRNVGVTSP
jgi:hypothetical protein